MCRECKAVYHKGRWTWGAVPPNSHEFLCPACHRIQDDAPSGVLLLTGDLVAKHRDEVLGFARNEEARVRAGHPLARIIKIEDQVEAPPGAVITTTDPHLVRRIGEALHHAHRGTFTCRYENTKTYSERTGRAKWR